MDTRHALWFRRLVKVCRIGDHKALWYVMINLYHPDAFKWDELLQKGLQVHIA